jgi:hypothetical protein
MHFHAFKVAMYGHDPQQHIEIDSLYLFVQVKIDFAICISPNFKTVFTYEYMFTCYIPKFNQSKLKLLVLLLSYPLTCTQ